MKFNVHAENKQREYNFQFYLSSTAVFKVLVTIANDRKSPGNSGYHKAKFESYHFNRSKENITDTVVYHQINTPSLHRLCVISQQ